MFRLDAENVCFFEVYDEDQTSGENPELSEWNMEISLHTLSGTFNIPQTIQLMGAIRGQQLSILIDTESTHNFIQGEVVEKLGITAQVLLEFHVFIGSGEFLICNGVCRQLAIFMQGITIIQDLFVLTMERANVVLGGSMAGDTMDGDGEP